MLLGRNVARRGFATGRRRIETILAHAGCEPDVSAHAVVAPIHLSTTFERNADLSYPEGFVYSREANPTRAMLERTLADIENGAEAAAFSSGMAAISAVLQSLAGSHVIFPNDVYSGTRGVIQQMAGLWGLTVLPTDTWDLGAIAAAVRVAASAAPPNNSASPAGGSKKILLYIETPSNPMLRVTDVRRAADAAREAAASAPEVEVVVAVDATWSTPLLLRPLELGADVVVHSLTKYMAGHSDVTGGAVIAGTTPAATKIFTEVRAIQTSIGAVLSPFDCYLTMRGMRSLPGRMQTHSANALAVARALEAHPAVSAVYYPGLESHPEHAAAKAQLENGTGNDRYGYAGMVSFELHGGRDAAVAASAQMKLFRRATSLGGTESLVEHRASAEGPGSVAPQGLLRLSVGLEAIEDLLEDMQQALATL